LANSLSGSFAEHEIARLLYDFSALQRFI